MIYRIFIPIGLAAISVVIFYLLDKIFSSSIDKRNKKREEERAIIQEAVRKKAMEGCDFKSIPREEGDLPVFRGRIGQDEIRREEGTLKRKRGLKGNINLFTLVLSSGLFVYSLVHIIINNSDGLEFIDRLYFASTFYSGILFYIVLRDRKSKKN